MPARLLFFRLSLFRLSLFRFLLFRLSFFRLLLFRLSLFRLLLLRLFLFPLLSFCLLLPLSILFSTSLLAESNALLVLPFQVSGKIPGQSWQHQNWQRRELPADLQEVTHFFLEISINHPLVSINETGTILRKNNFQPSNKLSPAVARQLCSSSDLGYLLAASAHFTAGQVSLRASSFSCSTAQILARSVGRGPIKELQGILKKLLPEVLPFFRFQTERLHAEDRERKDVVAVIDLSGSMSAELQDITAALDGLKRILPAESRLAIITIASGERITAWPITSQWNKNRQRLRRLRAGGETGAQGLRKALQAIERYRHWEGAPLAMIFCDIDFHSAEAVTIAATLRRLREGGIKTVAFSLQNQSLSSRNHWMKMTLTAGLTYQQVTYIRRAFFLDSPALSFLRKGSRFYTTEQNITPRLPKEPLAERELQPLQTWQFSANELNLERLPAHYARRYNRRLVRLGPIFSNLQGVIEKSLIDGLMGNKKIDDKRNRDGRIVPILVKNRGHAFWIRVMERQLTEFRRNVGKRIFVGLHFRPASGGDRLENFPEPLYLRDEKSNVPQLLVTDWRRLSKRKLSTIRPHDIWFLSLEILRIDNEREREDIRY